MSKQVKVLLNSLVVGVATLSMIAGAAVAQDSKPSGCECCKKMGQMSMPMPNPTDK
jgi:hypothetical protein